MEYMCLLTATISLNKNALIIPLLKAIQPLQETDPTKIK